MITIELLAKALPHAGKRAELFAGPLEQARRQWVGDDPAHVAMWLAQIAHESGSLRYVEEIASGEAYEGRTDLGNNVKGDGVRYKGRGLMQVTGRRNYAKCGEALGVDLIGRPELLEAPTYAAASAGWVWHTFGCAALMSGTDPVFAVTRRINGGTNGLADRRKHYDWILPIVKAAAMSPEPVVEIEVTGEQEAAPAPQPIKPAARPIIKPRGDMAPLVVAALTTLLQTAPTLIRAFSSSARGEKNAQTVEAVAKAISENPKSLELVSEITKQATGTESVVQAAELAAQDPTVGMKIDRVVQERWYELTEAGGGGISGAREFALKAAATNPEAWSVIKVVTYFALSFLVLANVIGAGFAGLMLHMDKGEPMGLIMLILQADIGAAVTALAFWLGSSFGSRQKDERVTG